MYLSPLGVLDLVLLITSMAISALIGLYFTNKNNSLDSYMLGDRKQSVIPVALSLMTSCMSCLSMFGSSAELYYQGPSYSFIIVSMILCGPIIAYTMLPIFYNMNELSLYTYLEKRYGFWVKYIVTVIYMFQMIFYNAVVLYVPSMALQTLLGVSKFYSILTIGLVCVVYSGIGGIKAVVWTDFFQAALMYLSIIVVCILGTLDAGGVNNVFKNANQGRRLNLDGFLNMDLTTRHTLFGILIGSTIKHVYLVGVNQVQIQRSLSLPTLKDGQRAFIWCAFFTALISILSTYMGLVLYSAYRSCDPFLAHEIDRRDLVIVHYVAHRLDRIPGLRGIFIAGIFSATLSTLSSFANSMSALALEDFIKPILRRCGRKEPQNKVATFLAKILAIVFGLVCVLMAYVIDKANSRLLQATTTMFGAVGVPFLAAFALGIFTRSTNTAGIIASLLVTITFGVYLTINQTFFTPPLDPQMPVYYNEQCAKVFNMTMSSTLLPPFSEVLNMAEVHELPPVEPPFSFGQISYMTLPAVQFVLTIVIASLVSWLTGGCKQQVKDEFLVGIMREKTPTNDIGTTLSDNAESINGEALETTDTLSQQKLSNLSNYNPGFASKHADIDSTSIERKRKIGVANGGFQGENDKA